MVLGEHRASARGKGEGSLISVREACIRSGFNHSVCWCWDEIGSEEGGGLGDEKWVVHILPTHPKKMMMRDTKPGWHTAHKASTPVGVNGERRIGDVLCRCAPRPVLEPCRAGEERGWEGKNVKEQAKFQSRGAEGIEGVCRVKVHPLRTPPRRCFGG